MDSSNRLSDQQYGQQTPSSNWALDPDMVALTLSSLVDRSVGRSRTRSYRYSRIYVATAITFAITGIAIGALASMTIPIGEEGPVAIPIEQQIPACEARQAGRLTVGNGPGGTTTGPEAILGFEYAYYVERTAKSALTFVAPDAFNVSAADLQQAIDTAIPVGTTHCVNIAEREPNTFDVDINERRPDGVRAIYRQQVSTIVRDGRVLIYEIAPR
ncbi:hypothetical protein ABZW96_35370 [Nocardia sp. NPDC004168]|uniref:hypothetical protein n=1 Tax=Nocardia sp. NPDC004168 TaxID=3154452 RepID=UPI0033A4B559